MDIKDYLKDLYIEKYGCEINRSLAEALVQDLAVTDGSERENGEKWTLEEAKAAGDKLAINWESVNKYEWFLVLNMVYSDYYRTAKKRGITDAGFFADLAYDWFHDTDGKEGKTFYYFMS